MDYHFTFKKKKEKIVGYRTNNLSGGPNLTPPPQISRIIQYKPLRIDFFCNLYITYNLNKETQNYNAKKRKQCTMSAHPGIDPGPLVPESDMLTTRPLSSSK